MHCTARVYNYGRDSVDKQTYADTERAEEVRMLVTLRMKSTKMLRAAQRMHTVLLDTAGLLSFRFLCQEIPTWLLQQKQFKYWTS